MCTLCRHRAILHEGSPSNLRLHIIQSVFILVKLCLSFNLAGSWLTGIPILIMTSNDRFFPKFVKYLFKALLLICLQLLVPGSLADLVVKEKDIADLQLDQLQAQAELVEDTTLPLECRRQVIHL